MAKGEYRTRLTEVECCNAWGISSSQFRQHATEASRWLQLDPQELEDLKARNIMTLERMVQDALRRTNIITGLPDYRSVTEAVRLTWEMIGPTEKDAKDVSEYTDEEIHALAEKALDMLRRPQKAEEPKKQDGKDPTEGS
jgi:hypothetical protein